MRASAGTGKKYIRRFDLLYISLKYKGVYQTIVKQFLFYFISLHLYLTNIVTLCFKTLITLDIQRTKTKKIKKYLYGIYNNNKRNHYINKTR
jgi:hypothetical protein